MQRITRGIWVGVVLAMAAPGTALAKRVVVEAVATDHRQDRDALLVNHLAREAARNDPRVVLVDVEADARGDGVRNRAAQLEQAKALLRQSLDALDNLQEAGALEKLNQAQALALASSLVEGMPVLLDVLATRAVTHFRLNQNNDGTNDLQAVLTIDPTYKFDPARVTPEIQRFVAETRLKVQDLGTTTLEVQTAPAPGEVWVDGAYRGVSPVELTGLVPGEHQISVLAPGYDLGQLQHAAAPGEVAKVTLPVAFAGQRLLARLTELQAAFLGQAPGPAAQALAETAQADEAVVLAIVDGQAGRELAGLRVARDGRVLAQSSVPLPAAEPSAQLVEGAWRALLAADVPGAVAQPPSGVAGPSAARTAMATGSSAPWNYLAAGTAAVSLVAGVALGISAKSDAATAKATPQVDPGSYQHAVDSAKGKALFADVCYGVSLGTAIAAGYLFYRDASQAAPPAAEERVELAPLVAPGLAGVAVGSRF